MFNDIFDFMFKGSSDRSNISKEDLDKVRRRLLGLKREYEDLKKDYSNLQSRFNRVEKEVADNTKLRVIKKFLPILDDLNRSVSHENSDGNEMIVQNFETVLEQFGLKYTTSEGDAFDEDFHDAVSYIQTDEFPQNRVIHIIEQGYVVDEAVIKYAKVVISR